MYRSDTYTSHLFIFDAHNYDASRQTSSYIHTSPLSESDNEDAEQPIGKLLNCSIVWSGLEGEISTFEMKSSRLSGGLSYKAKPSEALQIEFA